MQHGIEFAWIDGESYPVRDARSLFAWLWARGQIPVAGPTRICTRIAKVERFERWMDDRFPEREVEVWIGFEAGEDSRAAKDPNTGRPRTPAAGHAIRINRFPLIEWGLCRCRCLELVRAAGYPVPRKSACVFCPYASRADWRRFAAEEPAMFEQVVELEARKPPTSNPSVLGRTTRCASSRHNTALPVPNRARAHPDWVATGRGPRTCSAGTYGERLRSVVILLGLVPVRDSHGYGSIRIIDPHQLAVDRFHVNGCENQ